VPTEVLIDIDECAVWLHSSNRNYGHAPAGIRAEEIAHTHMRGTKYTILLAVDVTVGPIAWWIYQGGTSADDFSLFLYFELLPKIQRQHRILMCDNLASHKTAAILTLVRQANQRIMFRPAYSPDLSFIEPCFGFLKNILRSHTHEIDETNLLAWINYGLSQLTGWHVKKYAVGCHYFINGENYYPYQSPL